MVARLLLGHRLVRVAGGKRVSGTVVETEAYLGIGDKAAHSYAGRRTPRNESMWGKPGHVYVYLIYGIHSCFNVVTGRVDEPVAVLIRALEPEEGIETMFARRGAAKTEADLCSGPAKLCQALAIDRKLDGEDLVNGHKLFIERVGSVDSRPYEIVARPRVGVEYSEEWSKEPLRFFVKGNAHVSNPRQ